MPFSLRNCSSSSFLLRTPSAFQQASRKAFPPSALGRTTVLSYEGHDGFDDSSQTSFPVHREEAV
jgi:hypothetical protein